jgi:apolipoprotein N-acyltransferase
VTYLCGALAALSFPPFNAVPFLWLFFPALVFQLQGAPDKKLAFAVGWTFALVLLTVRLYWIAGALFVDIKEFWWLVPFAVFGLPSMFAVYHGLAALLAWRWGLRRVDGLLILAVAWALADYARGHLMTGFPWDLTGYVWGDVLPMMQITSVVGIYGLSLITLVLALLPAALAPPIRSGLAVRLFVAGLFMLAGLAGWGAWRLAQAPAPAMVDGVRLRLVQPNISQAVKWREDYREPNFAKLLELSFAPAEEPVTAIIWPETATAFYLTENAPRRQTIAANMKEGQLLLTGVVQRRLKPDDTLEFFNSLIAIDNKARVIAGYAKFHLVPFGEYVPFRTYLPFRAVAAVGDFTPGEGLMTLRAPGLPPFSPLICYEAIFPGEVARKDDPPQWLVNITNDAWYEGTTGPYQHFAIVRARAVEEGLPLVRVAIKGVDAVVDGYGRIVEQQGWDKAGFVDSPLPKPLPHRTVYATWGDTAFWLACGLLILLAFLGRVMVKKHG